MTRFAPSLLSRALLTGGAFLISAFSTHAVDQIWQNNGTNFNDAANWSTATPGAGDLAIFNTAASVDPELTSSLSISGLVFDVNGSGYTLSSSSPANVLTLLNSGAAGDATGRAIRQVSSGNNTISANIHFGATGGGNPQWIETTGTGSLIVNGDITTAAGGRQVAVRSTNSAGSITLGGNNNFANGLALSGSNNSLTNVSNVNGIAGSGTLTLGHNNGSFVNNTSGSTVDGSGYSDIRIVGNNGDVELQGGNWDFSSATLTISQSTQTMITQSAHVLLGGGILETSAGYNFTKEGVGTLEVQGASNYTGITKVRAGVLLLNNENALGMGNLRLEAHQTEAAWEGILGLGAGNFTRSLGTGAGQVQWAPDTGGAWQEGRGGFAAYGADRSVNLGGASAQLTWGVGGFVQDVLILGASDADATVDFQNPIDISGSGGARVFKANDGSADVDGVLSGVISGSQSLTKTGAGTLALEAANTYTGTTTISAGRLLVNESIASNFTVVQSGGALGGSGSVNNIDLQTGGAVTPGNSIGTLSASSLDWDGGSDDSFAQMQFELSNVDNSSDQLNLSGSFTKGTGDYFLFDFLNTGTANQTYTLVTFSSTSFVADDFGYTGLASGLTGEFSLNGSDLQFTTAIPEPQSIVLISMIGMMAVFLRRRVSVRSE